MSHFDLHTFETEWTNVGRIHVHVSLSGYFLSSRNALLICPCNHVLICRYIMLSTMPSMKTNMTAAAVIRIP